MSRFSRKCSKSVLPVLLISTAAALVCTVRTLAAVQPFPREALPAQRQYAWDLDETASRVPVGNQCVVRYLAGKLELESTGTDPYVELPAPRSGMVGELRLHLRARFATGGAGKLYWRTELFRDWSEERSQVFAIVHDQEWHDYDVPLPLNEPLLQLRLDPGDSIGAASIQSLELTAHRLHPLEIVSMRSTADAVHLDVHNHDVVPLEVSCRNQSWTLPAATTTELVLPSPGEQPFERKFVELASPGLPPLRRVAMIVRPHSNFEWRTLRIGSVIARFADDGSGAQIEQAGQLIGFIAPLASRADDTPRLALMSADEDHVEYSGDGVTLRAERGDGELVFHVESEQPCEGPVVRPLGELEHGLLAGLEYLGRGEESSSRLDIETDEHLRFAPDPLKVTMPLAVCRTTSATWSLTWDDMRLRPWYAVPNFLDAAPGHRMSLHGKSILAKVRITQESLEDTIERVSFGKGLPALPTPRPPAVRRALCLAALDGPLHGPGGWGHCAEPNWGRAPYADMASTLFYLTGQLPKLERLVPDGSHLRSDAAWLLSGRAKQWRELRSAEANEIRGRQQADGSFRYEGPLARGHFENTASGYEAERAARLLDWAWLSGDKESLDAGLKSLERLRRYRTPRGAQTWEVPLHTPDIMASAWLVRAHLRGYELTGREELLREAVKWGLSGVPFVYQWQSKPVMAYSTIAVLGATQWRAPNWIGLPVQWCGIVYADAVAQLAEHDQHHDWRRLAEGILRAAEQMQYPDGANIGCLPDSFGLASQERYGPAINPCALVYLRRRLDGDNVGLYVASNASHRIVAPFPVTLDGGIAKIEAVFGVNYQVIIDGQRIIDIPSQGVDVVPVSP